jgi:AraC-like DNA-binding protein
MVGELPERLTQAWIDSALRVIWADLTAFQASIRDRTPPRPHALVFIPFGGDLTLTGPNSTVEVPSGGRCLLTVPHGGCERHFSPGPGGGHLFALDLLLRPGPAHCDPLRDLVLPLVAPPGTGTALWESCYQLAACFPSATRPADLARVRARPLAESLVLDLLADAQAAGLLHRCDGGGPPSWLEELRRWIEVHHDRADLDVAGLARRAGVGVSTLAHAWHQAYGEGVMATIRTLRLEGAARHLRAFPDLRISTIARRCGWNSREHFVRSFRCRFGVPPSAWRSHRPLPD